ncbi:MAG: MFS transporter [Opitutales bacterium]|nr:MAG: MFS transporter [Opitutales bacterium]
MFIVNYIDRVNISFIKEHLHTDLGLNDEAFGFGAGLFFIGYAVFEIPSNLILQRIGARRWLAIIALLWGAVAACMAFVTTAHEFYGLRFLLGAAEAGFFPGVIYYLTRWLPSADRGKAIAIFLSGSAIASVISGPLSGYLLQFQPYGLKGWQFMIIAEGAFSVVLAVFTWRWLDSLPAEARWLQDGERQALTSTLEAEAEAANRTYRPSVWQLLCDLQIILFCVVYFAIQLTIYAATFWLPTIIRSMGKMTDMQVGCLNSLPWLISIAGMYFAAAGAARYKNQQAWVAVALLIAGLGMFLATTGGPIIAFVAICFAALGFKSASSLFWPIPQGYLDPRIAAAVIALINSIGNLGGFVAPYAFGWLTVHTGSIQGGLYGLALSSLVAAALVFRARTRA